MSDIFSSGLVIAVGTYDGVLAGWEFQQDGNANTIKDGAKLSQTTTESTKSEKKTLKLTFATGVHEGSIRSLAMAGGIREDEPGVLLSCGYDETLKTHDWHKRRTSAGEIRTPADFGTPSCSAFAPPMSNSTHCIVGFSNEGKICIYKKRDWSVQHVLAGHEGGVGALAVHPSGKMALSGGICDGKLKLWDLTKGRLAFVNKIDPAIASGGHGAKYDSIDCLTWSKNGEFYAMSHGSHITVREVASGKTLLDVNLPSRVNQVTLMEGPEGLFVAAACNDGSLPVLAVDDTEEDSRRAIMAIEPVDSHLAKEERFKCIQSVRDYIVVTANSAGVVSLMDLRGAIKMITSDDDKRGTDDNGRDGDSDGGNDDDDDDNDTELAVDIIESVRLGTGARILCLAAWCKTEETQFDESSKREEADNMVTQKISTEDPQQQLQATKRKHYSKSDVSMDADAVKKARSLVEKAKKLKMRRDKKKTRKVI